MKKCAAAMKKKVLKHLKEDTKEYKEGIADDKKLARELKKKKRK